MISATVIVGLSGSSGVPALFTQRQPTGKQRNIKNENHPVLANRPVREGSSRFAPPRSARVAQIANLHPLGQERRTCHRDAVALPAAARRRFPTSRRHVAAPIFTMRRLTIYDRTD